VNKSNDNIYFDSMLCHYSVWRICANHSSKDSASEQTFFYAAQYNGLSSKVTKIMQQINFKNSNLSTDEPFNQQDKRNFEGNYNSMKVL